MHCRRRLSILLTAWLLFCTAPVVADPGTLERAVKRFTDGYPADAVAMVEPLANAGDVDAQYLLANMLYSLSSSGLFDGYDDAVAWYRRAAEQGSADASYALGAIYDNRWRHSREPRDAARAIGFYRGAVDQGHAQAAAALAALRSRSGMTDEAAFALLDTQPAAAAPAVEIPAPPPSDPIREAAIVDEPATVAAVDDAAPEAPADPVATRPAPAESTATSSTPSEVAEQDAPVVRLADVADQCERYTQAGFDLYADSIRGARLTGPASVVSIAADTGKPGTYRIRFAENRPGVSLRIELRRVPDGVAQRFATGKRGSVSGIVTESETTAAGCSLGLDYQAGTG